MTRNSLQTQATDSSSTATSYEHWTSRRDATLSSFLWTSLFCLAIAILLWVLELADPFVPSLIVSFIIGWSILGVHIIVGAKIEQSLGLLATNTVATALGLALAVGFIGIYAWLSGHEVGSLDWNTAGPALFFGVLGTVVFTTMARMHQMREKLSQAEVERVVAERELTQAQLKTLQAQIEPHFLFNTLTTAMGLIHTKPAVAEETLKHLTSLLRNSLSRTRTEQSTLGEEFELIKAYLEISKIRMGTRLTYSINCDQSLHDFKLPPMLVQPLVENAITHGLEPAEQGGEIWVDAVSSTHGVTIAVTDSGLGLTDAPATAGTNTGLRNVRERLAQLYGEQGKLKLIERPPTGVKVTLHIPHQSPPPAA